MRKFGAKLKADLGGIHSKVDNELRRRQQAQVRPLSPIPYTLENTSALGGDRSKQGEGYLSDPGSQTSSRESSIVFEHDPQLIDNEIMTRLQNLEKKVEGYEKKVEELEASNALLRSSFETTKKELENQIEAAMQAIRNISGGGGQAPPGPSSSALEPRVESLSGKVDELQAQIDDIGKSPPQPQETPFQYWKSKGCTMLGIDKQGDTATVPFGCFDEECDWQNRTLTLNAYIQHLKRKHGINLIDKEVPDLEYLPKVSDEYSMPD